MGSKTQFLANAILDHCLGGAPYTPPGTVWIVLSSTPFDGTNTGDACDELPNADYTRLEASNDGTTWTSTDGNLPANKSNIDDLIWPDATTDWGTPASVYIADAASDGNLLYGADLPDGVAVGIGDAAKITAGTFTFSED